MTMTLMVIGTMIFLPVIGFILHEHSKPIAYIFISFPFALIIFLVGCSAIAINHYFVSTTNLEYESIGEFGLRENLIEEYIHYLGPYEKRENEGGYSYAYKDFFLRTDKKNRIVSMSAGGGSMETSSGLKI